MLELLASDYRSLFQDLFAITICVAAIIWGGWPERAVALTWLVVFEFGRFLYRDLLGFSTVQLLGVDSFLISSDLITGIVWIVIALYANRGWPLLVGAGQMIVMVGHVTKLWDLTMARRAYWVLTQMPFLLQLMVLLIGTLAHMNRERRIGPYQCWRWV